MWSTVYLKNGANGQLPLSSCAISVLILKVAPSFGFIVIFIFQFTDLTLAKENQTNFEEYLSNNSSENPGTVLSVTVLTRGFWPSYKSCNLNLPLEMVINSYSQVLIVSE